MLAPALLTFAACAPPPAFPGDGPDSPFRVVFSTYLGGGGKESARDIATDAEGNVYLTGGTETEAFPTTEGAFDRSHNGWQDVWVMKMSPEGRILWSTFLGGTGYDRAYAIEVRPDGSVVVGGRAGEGFPTTAGAVQEAFGGDVNPSRTYGKQDGFVACVSADGSELLWATYLGVDDGSNLRDLDVDAAGAVYVATGAVMEHPSPYWTEGAYQTEPMGGRDALVVKLAPDGSKVLWGTFIGAAGNDGGACSIRVGADGSAYLLGHAFTNDLPVTEGALQQSLSGEKDMFLARVAPDGASLVFLTYFGGESGDNTETHGLALGADGSAYIAASTMSKRLPAKGVTPKVRGPQMEHGGLGRDRSTGKGTNYPGDGFVARISPDGRELLGFSFFGGSLGEGIEGVDVDEDGNLWVSGATYSRDLPVTADALQPEFGGEADGFVACFSPDLSKLLWATHVGGPSHDFARGLAARPGGGAVVAGVGYGPDFPLTENALDRTFSGNSEIFVAAFAPR